MIFVLPCQMQCLMQRFRQAGDVSSKARGKRGKGDGAHTVACVSMCATATDTVTVSVSRTYETLVQVCRHRWEFGIRF